MKKFIYAILLTLAVSLSFYSCTEEVIEPKGGDGGGTIGAQRHRTRVKAPKAYGNLDQQQRERYG